MPEEQFSFGLWIEAPWPDLLDWGYSGFADPLGTSYSTRRCFQENGEVPCQTVACVAGELQLQFAKTRAERTLSPSDFAQQFLGITNVTAKQLFLHPWTYGVQGHHEVKLSHVVRRLKAIQEMGRI